jgi:asparagine synthase (glutamine-hydrolysing)
VDSSLIAAKAAHAGFERCVAVTPRFPEHPNPELEPAARVARRLGLEHLVVDVEDASVGPALPALIWRLEEPPRHYHAFALDKVYARVASEVDVVLDGNAGDALFGTREMVDLRIQSLVDWCPSPIRRSAARLLPARERGVLAMLRTHLQMDRWTLPYRSDAVVYSRPPSDLVRGLPPEPRPNQLVRDVLVGPDLGPMEHFQRLHVYTRNQSHTEKHDRLATPYGLSVVAPFLEPEMIAVATALPLALRVRGRLVKPVLKQLGSRYFPAEWMFARKQGFPVPIREWLSGPLRPWLSLLREQRTAAREVLRGGAFERLDPSRDFQLLWTSLTLEIATRQLLEDDAALMPPLHTTAPR